MKKSIYRKRVEAECARRNEVLGYRNDNNDLLWLAIVMEEVGEVAQAVLTCNPELTAEELIQAAAVIENWLTGE